MIYPTDTSVAGNSAYNRDAEKGLSHHLEYTPTPMPKNCEIPFAAVIHYEDLPLPLPLLMTGYTFSMVCL